MTSDVQRNLAAKIAGLQRSTPVARRAVYDELRAALQTEVRAAAPFMPVQTVIAKRRELEEAIIAIERMAARSDPPPASKPPLSEQTETLTPAAAPEPAPHAVAQIEDKPSEPLQPELVPAPAASSPSSGPFPFEPETAAEVDADTEEATAAVREFAPQAHEEVKVGRRQPAVIYFAAAAMIACVAIVVVLFAGSGGVQVPKQISPGRITPVAPASQAVIRPSNIPPVSPAVELIKGAGFGPAAQDALKEGIALLARGDHERAIAILDDAIRLDPSQPAAFSNRAFAHWSRGDAASAVRDYGEALRLEPLNPANRLHRAVAYNRLGEYERAIADLNEVIRIEPANVEAFSSRCWARVLFNHLQEALADCNEALKLRPKDVNTLDSRGLVYLKLGRLDRAIGDFNSALRIEPRLVSSLYGRGLAKIGRGDRAGGNEDVTAAKAISPDIQVTFGRYGVR